jgi:hypothetical protein
MNPDGHYGLQCVDLVDQYAQDIFEVPWSTCVGGVAGAKALLDRVPDEYWIRTDNNPNDPDHIPSQGDVVVFGGSAINEWGHTAVVDYADQNGMWVIQQDGFAAPLIWADGNWYSNKPAERTWLGYYSNGTGPLSGWLTPRREKLAQQDIVLQPAGDITPAVAGHQRITGAPVNQRTAASRSASIVKTFDADLILDFKGFVRGEDVDGNNVWFVGAYSDTYFWSGGFTDSSTNGLADLTPAPLTPPAPTLSPYQRIVGSSVIRYRKAPNTSAEIIIEYQPGDILTFSQFTRGESVNGNNIWFKGAISGGYAWSGGFDDQTTNGLTEEVATAPVPTPSPTSPDNIPTPAYSFVPDFDFVEYRPAHITNLQAAYDNPGVTVFPANPAKAVIHQFDAKAKHPSIDGVITFFQTERPGKETSAHFVVAGKRIVQMVSLKDRAYHAGTVGNNYIGIETDPQQDPETIASVKKLLKALKEKYGYEFPLTLHKDVPGNSTNCGVEINLGDYKLDAEPAPEPTPTPVPIPTPEPQPEPTVPAKTEEEIIDDFLASLKKAYFDSK